MTQPVRRRASRLANRPGDRRGARNHATRRRARYNWSVGLRRELGWGTAVDATYTGYRSYEHGDVLRPERACRTARGSLDLIPANRDPTAPANATPTAAALPAEFLRPLPRLSEHPRARQLRRAADYQALQVQVNRRYIRGVQFGAAYTLQRARGTADEDPGNLSITAQPPGRLFLLASWPRAIGISLVVNYSWDLLGQRRVRSDWRVTSLDGWQLSGENDFVTRRLGQRRR